MQEDVLLDCRGLQCPMPVVQIGRQMGTLPPGRVLKVLTTDRGALADVPAWAQDTGNEMLHCLEAGDHLVFYIRKGRVEA